MFLRFFLNIMSILPAYYLAGTATAKAYDCPPEGIERVHRLGLHDFVTTSTITTNVDWPNLAKYMSCTKNKGKADLWVHWFVPRLRSWIPPEEIAYAPRFSEDFDAKPMESCLEYGNLAEKTRAPFIGNRDDLAKVADENKLGCGFETTGGGKKETIIDKINKLYTPLRMFFPSSSLKPSESMLVLTGQIYLESRGGGAFGSFVYFDVEKFKGREAGDPSDVWVRPRFPREGEFLYSTFLEQNRTLRLSLTSQKLNFTYTLQSGAVLSSATYEFIDSQDRVLASFEFPIAVPRESR